MFRLVLVVVVTFFVHINRADNLPEGAYCNITRFNGTCTKARHCPSYVLLSAQNPEATICSHDGNADIVCCTDCEQEDVNKEAKPALTLDGVVWRTGGIRRYYDKCVDYASTLPYPCMDGIMATLRKAYDKKKKCHRVFMNEEQNTMAKKPKRVDFPNLALIGFIYKGSKLIHWQCQGFIISERYLATAAHCGRFANNIGYETYVAVGIDKRTETDTPTKVNTQDKADYDESSSWQQYKAKRFIQHPEWDCNNMYNDIALVETETEIKFDFNVLPMCLADHTTIPETVQVDILGIDNIRNNSKVQLQILKHTNCSELFSANGELRYNTQTCYQGFNEPVETCMGSSGRPIYATGELKCMKYVVGFTSFGLSCNHPDSATVYTRIQTYIPWIESIVWP